MKLKDWQIKFVEENKDKMMQKDIAEQIGVKANDVTKYFFDQRHFKVRENFFNVNCRKTIKTNEYSWIT